MDTRERLQKVLHWEKPDRVPNMEFRYWIQTLHSWHDQGLPKDILTDADAECYFGLEGSASIPWVPVNVGMYHKFEKEILKIEGDHQLIRDGDGNICRMLKP